MAASAFAGTGVFRATATGALTLPAVYRLALNNSFLMSIKADGNVIISHSGGVVLGPIHQYNLLQLWQDIAELGLVN